MTTHEYTKHAGKESCAIAQVIGRLGGGGAQRVAYHLAVALTRRDAPSLAVALRQDIGYVEADVENEVETLALNIDPTTSGGLVGGARKFRRLIADYELDVVHVHGEDCLPFVYLATRMMKRRPAIHFTWHNSAFVLEQQRGWRRVVMRRALRSCAGLSGSSHNVAQRLTAALGGDREVLVLRNGVPTPVPPPQRQHEHRPTIVWVGRLVTAKGPEVMLQACHCLAQQGHEFLLRMVGDAPPGRSAYAQQLQRMTRDLGLEDRVCFDGWVDDVDAILRDADIAVQTSFTEGLSMALLEQMMAGLAIVATEVGDTAPALDHGRCGLLIPPRDEAALTEVLRSLIEDPALRQKLGAAARQRAVECYSFEAMAEQALEMYGLCPTDGSEGAAGPAAPQNSTRVAEQ